MHKPISSCMKKIEFFLNEDKYFLSNNWLPRIKKAWFKENYFVKSVERPPSTLKFCPVIHEDWFEIKKVANSAISSPFPNRDIGWSLPKPSATFSLAVMKFDILEYDKLGEIVLNLILGAKSAAKDTLKPFRALFAEDMAVWFLKPLDAAIEEKRQQKNYQRIYQYYYVKS